MTEQPINRTLSEFQHFFRTQAFADGFRATFAILFPALLLGYLGHFEAGIAISTGCMCVSLTDAPGHFVAKRNGLLICTVFVVLMALLTSVARLNVVTMATTIAVACFFFSMFNVYGGRAAGIGNAAILAMIITMDKPIPGNDVLLHGFLILFGGLFYTTLSLLLFKIRPYRLVQRVLGDSIREVSKYLAIKADFYLPYTALRDDYNNMVAEQIKVHEKQDAVREVMFKTRSITEESTFEGRRLLLTFVEAVDLFESVTATYYDYALLREQYKDKGILEKIGGTLKKMAAELDAIGRAIEGNISFTRSFDYDEEVKSLKHEIDLLSASGAPTQVLKRILVNLRRILNNFNGIIRYFERVDVNTTSVDHTRFVSHQSLQPRVLFQNLGMTSSVFRHALRVAIACLAGFVVTKIFSYGHHSYWVLLTIAFILKPAFSLTKQRNVERIIGTLAGGLVAVLIFYLVKDAKLQFAFMVVFMLCTYSFMRLNYLAMVFFVTPYVLLLFNFFGLPLVDIAGERIVDTIVGCAIAFGASYLLFPTWEAGQLTNFAKLMLQANESYLKRVMDVLNGNPPELTDYKLARKNVYVASANLTAAFQRMLSEPRSKQANRKDVQEFVVLNHVLFSNIASVATQIMDREAVRDEPLFHLAKLAHHRLQLAIDLFGSNHRGSVGVRATPARSEAAHTGIGQQLEYIDKLSGDVAKVTATLFTKPL